VAMTVERLAARQREEGDWEERLQRTPTQQPKAWLSNVLLALHEAPAWQGVLGHDAFTLTTMVMLPTPWERGANGQWAQGEWTDQEYVHAANWLHSRDIAVAIPPVAAAVQAVAQEHAFHPVRDYLDGLEWDGLNRVEGFAANYLGADDSAYHAAVSRC